METADASPRAAIRNTHDWFERHSGWAPPDPDSLAEWMASGWCRCPDECVVTPACPCEHGLASWWLVLRSLDPSRASIDGANAHKTPRPRLAPSRFVPVRDRLDPARGDYVAVLDAHHYAVGAGQAGYMDPATGLFVQTAVSLWQRGSCCEQGCRHCPFVTAEEDRIGTCERIPTRERPKW
jgi:Family of unknown function (DUF5522)